MVGLTDRKLKGSSINMRNVEEYIATGLNCKTILGKVKEETLINFLKEIWDKEYNELGKFNKDQLLKLLLIKRKMDYCEFMDIKERDFKGYLLLDTELLNFSCDDTIIIDTDTLDFVDEEHNGLDGIPIYCRVIDLPIVHFSNMDLAEVLITRNLSDSGIRNHTHSTTISIRSGNANYKMTFPFYMNVQKGMALKMYFDGYRINSIICNGVIYTSS